MQQYDNPAMLQDSSPVKVLAGLARDHDRKLQHHASAFCYTEALGWTQKHPQDNSIHNSERRGAVLRYHLGLQRLQLGSYQEAIQCFQSASAVLGDSYLLWLRLAECAVELSCGSVDTDGSKSDRQQPSNHINCNADTSLTDERQKYFSEATRYLEIASNLFAADLGVRQQIEPHDHQLQQDWLQILLLTATLAIATDMTAGLHSDINRLLQLHKTLQAKIAHIFPSASSNGLITAGNPTGKPIAAFVVDEAESTARDTAVQYCRHVLHMLDDTAASWQPFRPSEEASSDASCPAVDCKSMLAAVAHVNLAAIHLQRRDFKQAIAHTKAACATCVHPQVAPQQLRIVGMADVLLGLAFVSGDDPLGALKHIFGCQFKGKTTI